MLDALQQISGWIKFLAITSFIVAIFSLLLFPIGLIDTLISGIIGFFLWSLAKALDDGFEYDAGRYLQRFFIAASVGSVFSILFLLFLLAGTLAR